MALPTWVAAGTPDSGAGNITPQWPAHQAGDIAVLDVESADQAVAAPDGWTETPNSPQAVTSEVRLTQFWRRATGASEVNPTIVAPGDHAYAVINTYRGCETSGDPWNVTSGDAEAADTSLSATGATTTVPDCLITVSVAHGFDIGGAVWGTWANTDLANVTERFDNGTGTGNGGGIAVATGEKATAGAFGATTATAAGAVTKAFITTALMEPQVGGTAAVTGTATDAGTSSKDLREVAGKTFVATLTDDTFIGSFSATDQMNLLNGIVAAVTQTNGWNNQRANIDHTTAVVRTSGTVVTITLPALPGLHLDHDDILEWTLPGSVLTGGSPIVATPTIRIGKKEPDPFATVVFRTP